MNWFLDIMKMSEEEYYDILKPHQVHPWQFDPAQVQQGEEMPDFDKWDRTDLSDLPLGPDQR
jgi:hypothetical protein